MTAEDYVKQYIGQLVFQQAMLQAEVDRLRAEKELPKDE